MISRRRFLDACGRCALALPFAPWLDVALAQEKGLRSKKAQPADVERWTRSVCSLCGLAEPVFLRAEAGELLATKGIPASKTGFGRLCPRARALVEASAAADRALRPMVRRDPATKGTLEGLEAVSWDDALAAVAKGLGGAKERLGAGGIAFVASDEETCETFSALARLAKGGLGTDNVDTPARLDALHAYDACAAVFGVSANPASVEDIDAATLILLVGGDIADSHPGVYYRALDARRVGRAKVVLVDSRRTLAASIADVHVRPRPGRDIAFVNALAAALLTGRDAVPNVPKEAASWTAWLRRNGESLEAAGVAKADAAAVADAWRAARGVVTLVGPVALGTAAGAPLARAVAQLHRASGQWGAVGRGCLLLPRGANATGALGLGIRPGALPAGGHLAVPSDRARAAAAWGVSADALPAAGSPPLLQWPAAARDGKLGALVVLRANVAADLPDALAWREALKTSFTVAASTHVPTETTVFADVVLPLALTSGETAGTIMSLDRRCERLEVAAEPPGEARPAERIVGDLARVAAPKGLRASFGDAQGEWERWRSAAAGTPFESGGITEARLGRELDVAWPCAAEDQPGAVRITPTTAGASAVPATYVATPAPSPSRKAAATPEKTFELIVGPLVEHERSRMLTGRTAELHYEAPTARLEMHPTDGAALGLAEGDWVTVSSETGDATARLWLTDRVLPGTAFLPEHYGFLSDVQGGNVGQKEPEGLAWLVVPSTLAAGTEALGGLPAKVTVRKAHRRDLRKTGL
ncbi:MAG: molybdopterin-dependent oxidoreductase [bacterium]